MDGAHVVESAAGAKDGEGRTGSAAEEEEAHVLPDAVIAHPTVIHALEHSVDAIGGLPGIDVAVEGHCRGYIS